MKGTFPKTLRLDGLRIVVDGAHGAAYRVAPLVFSELGADVSAIGVKPNGRNINDRCGALHPEGLAAEVVKRKAHLGIALDGDADRLIVVDEGGRSSTATPSWRSARGACSTRAPSRATSSSPR